MASFSVFTENLIILLFSLRKFIFFCWMSLKLWSTFSLYIIILGWMSGMSLGLQANISALDFRKSNIYSFTQLSRLVLIFKKRSSPSFPTETISISFKPIQLTRYPLLGEHPDSSIFGFYFETTYFIVALQ